MKFAIFSLGLTALLATAACTVDGTDGDPNGEVEASSDELASPNFGYFIVTHRDMRKCASPMCGGYFVKRVNEATTRCADGTMQAECYVAEIQLKNLGLSAAEEAEFASDLADGRGIVRARTYKFEAFSSTLGRLKANEGWSGASGATPDGTFYRGADNGIKCIKAPCPSLTAFQLNGHDDHIINSVSLGLTQPAADPAEIAEAQSELHTQTGILFAGSILLPKCLPNTGCGPFAIASEFYLPVRHREGQLCGTRGATTCGVGYYCAWEAKDICGAADAPGVCAPRPAVCPMIFKPVCACDGKTYSNACVAASAGASVSSEGPCN